MMLLRPINDADYNDLKRLAKTTGFGVTSLPDDEEYLKEKINTSLRGFDPRVSKPRGESYLFVLEDLKKKKIVGTSGLISKVGGFDPYFTYQIKEETYTDHALAITTKVKVLHLNTKHDGPSELCSLFLDETYRKNGLGRLLSLSRFLFVAAFPKRFDKQIICELRGVVDDKGHSPFWESVGRIFFGTAYPVADFLSGLGHKEFIKNLMPKYPIYISLLPKDVRKIIAQVHEKTMPARHLLEQEGMAYNNEVDIFDAGPTLMGDLNKIRTISSSKKTIVSGTTKTSTSPTLYLLSNDKIDFRACITTLDIQTDSQILIPAAVAKAMEIDAGSFIRYVSLK